MSSSVAFEHAPAPAPDELIRHYARFGFQSSVTPGALMLRNQREFARRPAVFDEEVSLTWHELIDFAARSGGYLHARGIGPGDVVMWQLPNWWECLVAAYGIWAAGAISSPVVPIYREHELRQVVARVRPRCVITAATFRGVDHVDLVNDACRAEGWEPPVRIVLRGAATGWTSFLDALTAQPFIADGIDPDAPALVGWTSGTTAGPKGVAHSSRSFISGPLRSSRMHSYGWDDRSYMPAPLAHATGLLSAVAIPSYTGSSVVLRDHWDAELALDDMARYQVTFSSGASVFIQELLAALEHRGQERLDLPTGYPCGGSTIPTTLAEAADDVGMQPMRSWGMTECPSVSGSGRFDPREIRCGSDGRVAPGCEVRVVDAAGSDLGPSEVGELLVRGPQRALGYLESEHTKESFDDEGWFRTGDLGYLTAEGVLSMTGRIKEIINRGGEKFSVREIEDALVSSPDVTEAAVVPAPHERLGEQAAAFVITAKGSSVSDEDLQAYLRQTGLSPQKIPRVWRQVDDLPRTASGKVKKFVLQAELADDLAEDLAGMGEAGEHRLR
ncbi:MAG TPA: AMP-binding protein [Acidimicrobiales bacterium]|nr:AMP-binding protein [Acidimicrobiales bacterium]